MGNGTTFLPTAVGSSLYWSNAPLPGSFGVGLVYTGSANPLPASIDLEASWNSQMGMYVFIGNVPDPDGMAILASNLYALATQDGTIRFLWLTDGSSDQSTWRPQTITVNGSAGNPITVAAAYLKMQNYLFVLGQQMSVALSSALDGLSFANGPNSGAMFDHSETVNGTVNIGWPLDVDPTKTVLPMSGPHAGALNAALNMTGQINSIPVNFFTALDVGIRYSLPVPGSQTGALQSLFYPLVTGPPDQTIGMSIWANPALPMDPDHTFLYYTTAKEMPSGYTSPLGHPWYLRPINSPASGRSARYVFHNGPASAGDGLLYLAPAGQFELKALTGHLVADGYQLASGISATEFFSADAADGLIINFVPQQPALASENGLASTATAPWLELTPAPGVTISYHSQPSDSVMYTAPAQDQSSGQFLVPLLKPGLLLDGSAPAFPMAPYAGIDACDPGSLKVLESGFLTPLRQQALTPPGLLDEGEADLNDAARVERSTARLTMAVQTSSTPQSSVTPQGLIGTYDSSTGIWQQLSMVCAESPQTVPSLALNSLSGKLAHAISNSQLFLVAADGPAFLGCCSLNYWVNADTILQLATLPESDRPPAALLKAMKDAPQTAPVAGISALNSYVQSFNVSLTAAQKSTVGKYAAYFQLSAAGWTFRISPTLWDLNRNRPTIMIFKFASGTLRSLAKSPRNWSWSTVGALPGGSANDTANHVTAIIDQATTDVANAAASRTASPLAYFVNTVCDDPTWTGVLFLDAQVPLATMPSDLQGIAFGVDRRQMIAHHVGISVTPVLSGGTNPRLGPTAVFGLTDYTGPPDITYCPGDFAWNVEHLQLQIRNSASLGFTCRAQMYINRLFGDTVQLVDSTRYNNLQLTGSYSLQNGVGSYTFGVSKQCRYRSSSAVVDDIEFTGASLTTEAVISSTSSAVRSRLKLKGKLRFKTIREFDIFSYGNSLDLEGNFVTGGYLKFSHLGIDITTDGNAGGSSTYTFNIADLQLSASSSVARPLSLAAHFPITPVNLVYVAPGQTPSDLGYAPVQAPLYQPSLKLGWYGLIFSLDMGSLGSLASSAGLGVKILAAWGPSDLQAAVNVGLQLPGSQATKSLPAIENVLKAGFESLVFSADGALNTPPNPAYVLRMQHFYLSLLGWKIPPGQADMYLFGDPSTGSQRSNALGWYAAWSKG